MPRIPPDGIVGTSHVVEKCPHGWDVVVEIRQLRPDLEPEQVFEFALLEIAEHLDAFGINPLVVLRREREDPSRLDDEDEALP